MGPESNDYTKWSEDELRRAELVANKFLSENGAEIWEYFKNKVNSLDQLIESLRQPMEYDARLDCFARIAEVARALEDDAEGFFGMASEPVVARILRGASTPRR
jgi:hypothetical protein